MAVIETWLTQDLQKPVSVNHLNGNLFSNNGNANRIGVILTDNGEPVTISGTVSGYAVTADGSTVPCTGTKSGNKASILVPAAAYQPGQIFITVFITDGTTVTTVGAVSSNVMRSRTNAQVDPGSAVTDWTQTINAAMQSVETAAANLVGIVAVPYASITFPVPLGKYTYYNNNLYRCISPIASSESFTAAHWIQVRLGDDVSDLKSAIDQTGTRMEWTQGGYVIASTGAIGSSTNAYSYTGFIEVEGDYLYIHTHIVGTAGIAFYDENHDYISGFSVENNPSPYEFSGAIPIPANAKYFRATTREHESEAYYCAGGLPDIISFLFLKSAVETIAEFDYIWQNGAFVFAAGPSIGYTQEDTNYSVTGYIPVKPGMKIRVKTYMANNAGICFFTSESPSSAVSGVVNPDNTAPYLFDQIVTVPSNANYMRVTCRKYTEEVHILLDIVSTLQTTDIAGVDWSYAGLNNVNKTGQFEADMTSFLAYKNTKFTGDNGTRFYLVPKGKVESGTGGCLKIFGDNYPYQGDYRDLGIYFSANQNGDTGYYGNGVYWINVKVYDTGAYANKHPELGFSFQDGHVVAGKVFCFNNQKPFWLFGGSTQTMKDWAIAEFTSNIGISANGGGIILKSPNGTKYKVSVDNSGNLVTSAVT